MAPIEKFNVTTAVLWEFSGYSLSGEWTVSAPVEIQCRWEDSLTESPDAQSSPIAKPVKAFVNQSIPINSILYQGCLEDVVGTGTGFIVEDMPLLYVTEYNAMPDIKGRKKTRTITLRKYSNTLPVVV